MKAYESDGAIVLVIEEKDWMADGTIEVGGHKLVMDPSPVVEKDEDDLSLDEEHEIPFVFNPAADMGIKLLAEAEGTGDPALYLRTTRPLLEETLKEDPKDLMDGQDLADTQPSLSAIPDGTGGDEV